MPDGLPELGQLDQKNQRTAARGDPCRAEIKRQGDPNIVSWGQMVYDGKAFLQTGWWISTLPGLSIMMIVVIFYMIGDGLNYALSPRMKKL